MTYAANNNLNSEFKKFKNYKYKKINLKNFTILKKTIYDFKPDEVFNLEAESQVDNSIKNEEYNDSSEMPPERDLRDVQPTISVNYRVIKDNGENEVKGRRQTSQKTNYQDDWDKNFSEW